MSPLLDELIDTWSSALPEIEAASLGEILQEIQRALAFARSAPATLDGRTRALIVTKLEEAQHWALTCLRLAVERERKARDV